MHTQTYTGGSIWTVHALVWPVQHLVWIPDLLRKKWSDKWRRRLQSRNLGGYAKVESLPSSPRKRGKYLRISSKVLILTGFSLKKLLPYTSWSLWKQAENKFQDFWKYRCFKKGSISTRKDIFKNRRSIEDLIMKLHGVQFNSSLCIPQYRMLITMLFCNINFFSVVCSCVYGKNWSMIERILFYHVLEDISPTKP